MSGGKKYFVTGYSNDAKIINTYAGNPYHYLNKPQYLGFVTLRRATYELRYRKSVPEERFLESNLVYPKVKWDESASEGMGIYLVVKGKKVPSTRILRGPYREMMFIAAVGALRICVDNALQYSVVIKDLTVANWIRRANTCGISINELTKEMRLEIERAEIWLKSFDYKTPVIVRSKEGQILDVVYHRDKDPLPSENDGLDEPETW